MYTLPFNAVYEFFRFVEDLQLPVRNRSGVCPHHQLNFVDVFLVPFQWMLAIHDSNVSGLSKRYLGVNPQFECKYQCGCNSQLTSENN